MAVCTAFFAFFALPVIFASVFRFRRGCRGFWNYRRGAHDIFYALDAVLAGKIFRAARIAVAAVTMAAAPALGIIIALVRARYWQNQDCNYCDCEKQDCALFALVHG
jgi:ABC-type spermidine/putrescine transport system permease subunit II